MTPPKKPQPSRSAARGGKTPARKTKAPSRKAKTSARSAKRPALGRGLDALLGKQPDSPRPADAVQLVPLAQLKPNPHQPRRAFNDASIDSLAATLREHGVLQPILAKPDPNRTDGFIIVAGERRWRAAQRAQIPRIPVLVRTPNEAQTLTLALVENLQREDLNPVEEALGYQDLVERRRLSRADVARLVGKSRPHVSNALRLLSLPTQALEALRDGSLHPGAARAALASNDPLAVVRAVLARNLSVRQAEALAAAPAQTPPRDPHVLDLEQELSNALALQVQITHHPSGSGKIRIRYRSVDQLQHLRRRLLT